MNGNLSEVSKTHPRYDSLKLRARMVEAYKAGILADSGLIAHGRGEAFDYLIGERTSKAAENATEAAAAALLLSEHPVISVNGNTAALAPREIVELAQLLAAPIEINLFYRTPERMKAVEMALRDAGAREVLGREKNSEHILGLEGPRSRASKEGIYKSDVVLVPLEDGDRAQALINNGKQVITIDLNPLSRTAKTATITIVDNLVRALPNLIKEVKRHKNMDRSKLKEITENFNNRKNLQYTLNEMTKEYITKG